MAKNKNYAVERFIYNENDGRNQEEFAGAA
jgi:hypothetical protein